MMKIRRLRAVGLGLIAVVGCFTDAQGPLKVVGHYELNHGSVLDALNVLAGGTYVHTYGAPPADAVVDTGTWHLDMRDTSVVLSNFRAWSEGQGDVKHLGSKSPGLYTQYILPVVRTSADHVRLVVDFDRDISYEQTSR
jgi:hypothetical protein